jgi:hypothetical protein
VELDPFRAECNPPSVSCQSKKPLYSQSWEAISAFIEEDGLAAFILGLRKPYFGYAQASKPKDLEEAYVFLCNSLPQTRGLQIICLHKTKQISENKFGIEFNKKGDSNNQN